MEETMIGEWVEDLPCEAWSAVLEYDCLAEALSVHDLSLELERACGLAVRVRMTGLRLRLCKALTQLKGKLADSPPAYDNLRMSVLKSVVLLRYLLTEVNILFSLVWTYSEHLKAWIFLCPHLVPVVREIDNLIQSALDLDVRREDLSTFNMRMLLNTHHEFLRKYDSELAAKLVVITGIRNFEMEALDILLCCPSANCQLSVTSPISEERSYDISSFFGFNNLKPVFQVPDVHNSNLSTEAKKTVLLRYLRECVQWENLTFLQSIVSKINDLEYRVGLFGINDDMRFHLIMKLSDKYDTIHENPYPTLYRNIFMSDEENSKLLKENYFRFASYNANMTGLCVFVNTCDQPPENLPLAIHHFRGQLRPMTGEKILDSKDECLSECFSYEENKRHLQLCIHYREGFNSCPAETIINVAYDHQTGCHISYDYIESVPFQQLDTTCNDTDDDT